MLVKEVDTIGLQTPERGLGDGTDAFRAAVERVLRVAVLEAELGSDHHLVAKWRQCLADQFLVDERTVAFGGVEECDTVLEGRPDQFDAIRLFSGGPIAEAQAHASKTDCRHFKTAVSQFAFLHDVLLSECRELPVDRHDATGTKLRLLYEAQQSG